MKDILSKIKEIECPETKLKCGYYVYLLLCKDLSLYCGSTANLRNRFKEHNSGEAAAWTNKRQPVRLVYYEVHDSLLQVRRREKQIKGWTVKKKLNLINGVWKNL